MMIIKKIFKNSLKLSTYLHIPQKCFQFYPEKLFDPTKDKFINTLEPIQLRDKLQLFQLLDYQGNCLNKDYDNQDSILLNRIYETMIKTEEFDFQCLKFSTAGKLSFYLSSLGETASIVGSAAALSHEDLVFPQYREQGVLFWRGFTFQQALEQCTSNFNDLGKGRQMPIHYGSKELNYATTKSPLASQIPQAAGVGYGYKLKKQNRVCVAYFGEGSTSEGDFHAGLNFAQTLNSQTLFICRNNQWAISTPQSDQFGGELADRSASYGIRTYKVDGNDALAVYICTKQAREYIVNNQKPAFIELLTYRIGHHSTSDDSNNYRSKEEVKSWRENNNAIKRFQMYLKKSGKREFDEQEYDQNLRKHTNEEITKIMTMLEKQKKPNWSNIFTDVYDSLPANLVEQSESLENHVYKYRKEYKDLLNKYQRI